MTAVDFSQQREIFAENANNPSVDIDARMRIFVRACAERAICTLFDSSVIIAEARAIVAELEPVDPDEREASLIAMSNAPETFPTDTCGLAAWVMRGIKRGRALAAEGR